ncbi:hypothetical protein Ahy_A08g040420 [Arachis hypogaea]|uniref:GRF-type domain-containing protein n=1 Tax=Arachis hypogaea TaxID=3818 RepID=A0A445BZ48_ARAHY|nr:hypothetical protein Ahy_A08g040420 [Arachis hypogaea]
MDLEEGFFLVRFANQNEYNHALFESPWRPLFIPQEIKVQNVAVWVRIPNLPAKLRSTSGTYGSGNITGYRFCECGLRAPLQVSNSVANPGRKYYACPIRRCGWFRWAGPSIQHSDVGDDRSSQLNSNFKTSERVEKLHTDVVYLKFLAFLQLLVSVVCVVLIITLDWSTRDFTKFAFLVGDMVTRWMFAQKRW